MRVRVINDYIEINYERVAKLLPGTDRRNIEDEILGADLADERYQSGYEDGSLSGYSAGLEAGKDEGKEDAWEEFQSVLEYLRDIGDITEEIADKILRAAE